MKKIQEIILSTYKPFLIFLLIYIVVRVLIFNINSAEWGDTYRMVRASEFLTKGIWPWDEKRWPMFSVLLMPGIYFKNAILWGKLLVFIVSLLTLIIQFDFFKKFIINNNKLALVSVILTATSPIFAYWSFRVMADPFFTFIALLSFYLYFLWQDKFTNKRLVILSVILLMATMTRLEGIFVIGAIGITEILKLYKDYSNQNLLKLAKIATILAIPQILVFLPFTIYAKFIYEGFVHNDYIAEVATFFSFDMDRIRYFIAYDLFYYGLPFLFVFIYKSLRSKELKIMPLFLFILFETILGFIWTPSMPRIHMPLIPFFSMLFVYGVYKFRFSIKDYSASAILMLIYVWLQFKYKLYFLNLSYIGFTMVLFLSFFGVSYLFFKQGKKYFFYVCILTMVITSLVVVANETSNYKTIADSSNFAKKIGEKIAYSDESGVSEFILGEKGLYLDKYKYIHVMTHDAQWNFLLENKPDYIITTNGFEKNSKFDLQEGDFRDNLTLVYSSKYNLQDVFDVYLEKLGLIKRDGFLFETDVWKINY